MKFILFWWKLNFYIFHVYKRISYELHCLSSWLCLSHDSYTLYLVLTHDFFYFMNIYVLYCYLSCRWSCDFHVFMDTFMFYFLFEEFRTSFQNYHKLVHILHLVEFSIMLKLFLNLFLKITTHNGWLDGRPCLVCSNWKSF